MSTWPLHIKRVNIDLSLLAYQPDRIMVSNFGYHGNHEDILVTIVIMENVKILWLPRKP